jgi:DNA-binding transcriptional ArsR family regulator
MNASKEPTLTRVMETDRPPALDDDTDIAKVARCVKAMAHPLRLKILCALSEQPASVQDIVERVGTSQSNISQHLSILREKNILGSKKEANRVFYFIDDERVLKLITLMRDVFCAAH